MTTATAPVLCKDGTLAHWWKVKTPSNPEVKARCKRCRATRMYPTTPESLLDGDGIEGTHAMHLTPQRASSTVCSCGGEKTPRARLCARCYQLEKKSISLPGQPFVITASTEKYS